MAAGSVVRVKICGIRTREAALAAMDADWIGLNFIPASPRFATLAEAGMVANVVAGTSLVGLFQDPSDDDVATAVGAVPLAALQVYASPERVAALRARFGLPVWQSRAIGARADLPKPSDVHPDAYVLDAVPPPGSVLSGGNAVMVDWALLKGWPAPAPWLLAGGLTPANVATAIDRSGAPAVDVSSGVERVRGQKDPALIRAFIAAARAAA